MPGVSATDFQAAVARAFATWQAVPTASISYQFGGSRRRALSRRTGRRRLALSCGRDLDRVLASTSFTIDDTTGYDRRVRHLLQCLVSLVGRRIGGTGKFDLESVALHEIGHFNGLGHSALGETELLESGGRRVISADAVMFPISLGAGEYREPHAEA